MSYPIRKYAALVIALACFVSCQDESLLGGDAAGNVKILARISGSIPTRTCVDGVTTDGSVGILWSPGDRIGVYGSAGRQTPCSYLQIRVPRLKPSLQAI